MSTTTGGRRTPLRAAYLDLDGTLLGQRGSFLHDGAGDFTLLGARALEACARAGVEPVIVSGRRLASLSHDARLLGIGSYACEAGALLVVDGEQHWLTGPYQPRDGLKVYDMLVESGAPGQLLERHGEHLVEHPEADHAREVSHVYIGDVDADEVNAELREAGHTELRFLDNGPAEEGGRVYHLLPTAASKAASVEAHMRIRGYAPEEVIAVGDSREDHGMASAVGTFWFVANGAWIPGENVRRSEATNGDGVYEAIITELAERR